MARGDSVARDGAASAPCSSPGARPSGRQPPRQMPGRNSSVSSTWSSEVCFANVGLEQGAKKHFIYRPFPPRGSMDQSDVFIVKEQWWTPCTTSAGCQILDSGKYLSDERFHVSSG